MKNLIEGKHIAVVGNSKGLFSSGSGRLIDSHDVVCRMNKAWLNVPPFTVNNDRRSVFRHIGMKTDLLFVNMVRTCGLLSILKNQRPRINYQLVQTSPFGYDDPSITDYCSYIISREEFNLLDKKLTKKPSTGLRVLHLMSLLNPASVTVFGFDWKKSHPSYWGRGDDWSTENHDFDEEQIYCKDHFIDKKNDSDTFFKFIGMSMSSS